MRHSSAGGMAYDMCRRDAEMVHQRHHVVGHLRHRIGDAIAPRTTGAAMIVQHYLVFRRQRRDVGIKIIGRAANTGGQQYRLALTLDVIRDFSAIHLCHRHRATPCFLQ